jgi:hypothetical protein
MRSFTFFLRGLIALALVAPVSIFATLPVSAATTVAATTTCSNGVDNTGGLGLICQVTVVNTIAASGGSATVTVRECHGAAGAPTAACSTRTTTLTKPVTAVTQCNNSINGGGGTLRCSVDVTTNLYGVNPTATPAPSAAGAGVAASVNQCVGSGESGIIGQTIQCDPFPATTTGAAITECNASANGGTLVGLTCTATGTMDETHVVTINQCNGSANGGGALVICTANMATNAMLGTPPPTGTIGGGSSDNSTPAPLLVLLATGGFALAVIVIRRRSIYDN